MAGSVSSCAPDVTCLTLPPLCPWLADQGADSGGGGVGVSLGSKDPPWPQVISTCMVN